MKNNVLALLMAWGLLACTSHAQQAISSNQAEHVKQVQTIYFTGPYDLSVTLQTNDAFATATLSDDSDRRYLLTAVPSGSGVKLANDEGVSLHFKTVNGQAEGVLNFVQGKDIQVTEFKQP